jgi:NAD(P)-dependent dehydrogenase (short-subunit alcohol dehydrogenase family)
LAPTAKRLNKDADGARKFLAEEGHDGRIVSEVWVVDAELGEHFAAYGATSASVQAFGSSLDVTVTGGKYGSQTITLSPGTTFAYKLHKVKDWNKDKTQIEDMEADYKGMA